jgi:NAD(P)-dependent dehydrogenase (short-subunit alcohol dehydrogenase family)
MQIDFHEKTVIVTGAAHGFGRAIAVAFATRGGRVWACDILSDELAETGQLCVDAGGICEVRTVDITEQEAVFAFVNEAQAHTGSVAVLVNNAGGVRGQVGRPLEEITPTEWQDIFNVNVTGAFYFAQAVANESRTLWSNYQHLQWCGVGHQPDWDSGIRCSQSGSNWPDSPASPRIGSLGDYSQQYCPWLCSLKSFNRTAMGVIRGRWAESVSRAYSTATAGDTG